jgi:hypothetical protein
VSASSIAPAVADVQKPGASAISLETTFRGLDLRLKHLEKIAHVLAGVPGQRWLCAGAQSHVVLRDYAARDHKRGTLTRTYRGSTLPELLATLPENRFRSAQIEVQVAVDGYRMSLRAGSSGFRSPPMVLTLDGPDGDPPQVYYDMVATLSRIGRFSRFWRKPLLIGFGYVILGFLLTQWVWNSYWPQLRTPLSQHIFIGIIFVIALGSLRLATFAGRTASEVRVTLFRRRRSRHPMGRLIARDGDMNYRTYIATVLAMAISAISVAVALAAWLIPR